MIYHGPLKPMENSCCGRRWCPWAYLASARLFDYFWYPFVGHKRVKEALNTPWGRLFEEYGSVPRHPPGLRAGTAAAVGLLGLAASALALTWLLRRGRKS